MQNQKLRDPDSRENSEWLSANIEHWLTPQNIQGKKEFFLKKKYKLHEKSTLMM